MGIFHNRPLATGICISVLAAVLLQESGSLIKLILIPALLFGFLLFLLFLRMGKRQIGNAHLALGAALLLSAFLLTSSYLFFDRYYEKIEEGIGETVEIEGAVLGRVQSSAYSSQLEVRITSREGEKFEILALVDTAYASALQRGDCFRMTVTQRAFTYTESLQEEVFLLSDGIVAAFVCESPEACEILPEKDNGLAVTLRRWQSELSYRLQSAMGKERGALASALLLGNREALSSLQSLQFRRAGVSHLLALSGLHVSILVGLLEWFLRRLHMPKQGRAILIPLAAVGYLFLTGCSPSTLRAVLMLCALYVAVLLREDYDGFTVLCAVLGGILLFSPNAVLDLSLWMSFLAAGSILIFSPLLAEWLRERDSWPAIAKRLLRLGRGAISAVFVAVTVNIAMLMLTAFAFGEVALFAIPATLLLSLPTAAVLILSLAVLVFPSCAPLVSLCSLCTEGMLRAAELFSKIEGAVLAVSEPAPRIAVALLGVLVILFAVLRINKRRWVWLSLPAAALLAIGIGLGTAYLPSDEADMIYVNKSDGCICLFVKDGVGVAVDFSGGRYDKAYELRVAAREVNCTEIRDLVFTRYANLQPYVLQENATAMRVANLHLPVPRDDWERAMAKRMEQQASLYGIRVHYGYADVCREVAEITFTDRAEGKGTDHLGQYCALSVNGKRILLLNMAAMASPLASEIENLALAADVVTVLDDGLTAENRTLVPAVREDALCVILEEERLLALLPAKISEEILRCAVDSTRVRLK